MPPRNLQDLLKFNIDDLQDYDDVCKVIGDVNVSDENDETNLKKAFDIAKYLALKLHEENKLGLDLFEQETEKQSKRVQDLEEELQIAQKNLNIYRVDRADNSFGGNDPREISILESKNDSLKNEIKELESKMFHEKSEKDKLQLKIEELEKKFTKLARDNERLEEESRDYGKKFQALRDEKYSRTGEESEMYQKKINQKNIIINELENENMKLSEENLELNRLIGKNKFDLQDSTTEMVKTREEIRKLKLLQRNNDEQLEEIKKENELLKSQIEVLNAQINSHHDQDSALMNIVESRVKEFRLIIEDKDEEIKKLRDLLITMRESLSRTQIDSDKASVSALTKAVQDKDGQIEILKKQLEDYAREMDKSAAVINNLNKTFYENSKMYSKSAGYNINKQAEQKIIYLENMLRENDGRLKESEQHAISKEKELNEALTRLREYESGDYQLQQAVNEIKGLKNQIKIRDRDIETLTKHLNKLDFTLNDVLEENDDFRAKLGMQPKEKLNLDELNNLRAIKAQENRAYVYVLQREIETLNEERTKLKQTIRKMAKEIGSKESVASILDEINLDYYDDLIESKNKKQKDQKDTKKDANGSKIETPEEKKAKENEQFLMKKRNEQLMQIMLEFENENKLLKKALGEINQQLNDLNKNKLKGTKSLKDQTIIKCPSLDKLLSEMESQKNMRSNLKAYSFLNQILSEGGSVDIALKSEIDYLHGRNEELTNQILIFKAESNKAQINLLKAQDEIDRLNSDVRLMNKTSAAKDIFQPFKLPAGMAPSSQDIISALNEYLIDTLQELEEYKKITQLSEKDLETLKRKYSVVRHQISLLYKDYIEESKAWKSEKENLLNSIKKLNDVISVDAVKLQEYKRLLELLEKDEPEIRRLMAENSRSFCVLRSKEKELQIKCDALEQTDLNIVKENKKMRIEIIEMEIAVQQRFGYLERYKDMANYRIMTLQKKLEESIPVSKMDALNVEYNNVVQNYRQMLDRQENNEALTISLQQNEQLNKKFEAEINFLKKELENEKEKGHILEENLNRMKIPFLSPSVQYHGSNGGAVGGKVANGGDMSNHDSSMNSGMISMAKRLTALEMKELNERQKADHAQRMYDQQRVILRDLENRNLELEDNFSALSKKYLNLEKSETHLREQLCSFVPKSVDDTNKQRIQELEKHEHLQKLEISRLRELTEITLYQTASLDFINNVNKMMLPSFSLALGDAIREIDPDDLMDRGKMHRQLILMQISEATAVRKLQQAQSRVKKLEAQLVKTEQKYDRDNNDFFNQKKEYISKITYLRSTIQDLRHKYTGSIPLKQQEKFKNEKEKLMVAKREFDEKIIRISDEKYQLEDLIAEYTARNKEIEMLKNAAKIGADGSVKFNEKFLDSFKKSENLRMINLKLERANRRNKDQEFIEHIKKLKFYEEINRKLEIAIISLEEENLRLESDYDQKTLIWEHREADLERSLENLRKQHQMIENLAINFEEISGNMPDHTQPIANQLEQAIGIIRSHIKLLAESKIQADLSKNKIQEMEINVRKYQHEVDIRDKAIAELRLRLPATIERDILIKSVMGAPGADELSSNQTSIKAAQATIESLQSRLKQKDDTISKYQDMLKLARDEITNINKQHELEITNMLDKLNLTRDSNLKKLKQDLKSNTSNRPETMTKVQLSRLQELEEVTVEQDNVISALNQKIKTLNTEMETWKARFELAHQKAQKDVEKSQKDQINVIEKLNKQIEEYRDRIAKQDNEMNSLIANLENQKQLSSKSPSAAIKSMVDKLKQQLAEKEEQQQILNKALLELKGDMVNMAKINLNSMSQDQSQEKNLQTILNKACNEYQDKILSLTEDNNKLKAELKTKQKTNDELNTELEHFKLQLKTKDQKLKRLSIENDKLIEDSNNFKSSNKIVKTFDSTKSNTNNEVDFLKRQIKQLEDKLKRHQQQRSVAEKPYVDRKQFQKEDEAFEEANQKPRSKSPKGTNSQEDPGNYGVIYGLKSEIEQWKTRYNFVLSENTVLNKQKNDLELLVARLKRENSVDNQKILKENQSLRDELLGKSSSSTRLRSKSPNDIRNENKGQLMNELEKLKRENEKLNEKAKKVEQLENYVNFLKSGGDLNDSAQSSSSTGSNIRKIGESGKSTTELEKTIALMKKVIVKLQKENEALKLNSSK